MIGSMVGDVLAETKRRVAAAAVDSLHDVRSAGMPLVGFSASFAAEERELKRFLYERLYNSPQLAAVRDEAQRVVANLAAAYRDDPKLLPEPWQRGGDRRRQLRTIGDFIAGMTDR
jgi:dGTPase